MSEQLNRFAFASPSAMLLARFLDLYEANKLTEMLTELSQSLYGGRLTSQYTPELSLVGRTLYYSCSLLNFGFTPGQALCDLSLVRTKNNDTGGGNRSGTVAKVQRFNILLAIALYSLIPYVFERRSSIISGISAVYDVVLAPELGIANPTVPAQPDEISDTNLCEDQSDVEPTDTVSSPRIAMESFLTKFMHALTAAVASIASSCSERVEAAVNFLMDVHRFFFFLHGSYLELPLRLAQLRLVTQSLPKHKASLKPLAWLLGFRISLLAYYAARVLFSQLDQELHRAPAADTATAPTEETSAAAAVSAVADSKSSSHAKCALCIDTLTAPATVPCGHIFCWTCIVGYAASEGRSGGAGGGVVKCPICRTEFPGQRIRALYNYS